MSNPFDDNTAANRKAARTAQAIISVFRELDPGMQVQQVSTFLHVMAKPDSTMKEIEQATLLSSSTISRHVMLLGDEGRGGKPGLKIVVRYEDPEDRRVNRVKLTAAGRNVAQKLVALLED